MWESTECPFALAVAVPPQCPASDPAGMMPDGMASST